MTDYTDPRTRETFKVDTSQPLSAEMIRADHGGIPLTAMQTLQYDVVSKAKHYNTHPSGIEAIHLVRCLNFNMGNALKYVMRRHGKEYERSLRSAQYYLRDQQESGNQMVVNLQIFKLLSMYMAADPVQEAQNFYRAFDQYLNQPIIERYDIAQLQLLRLLDSRR